jgi:hypothetical protein
MTIAETLSTHEMDWPDAANTDTPADGPAGRR